jgi:hypothetical protein
MAYSIIMISLILRNCFGISFPKREPLPAAGIIQAIFMINSMHMKKADLVPALSDIS